MKERQAAQPRVLVADDAAGTRSLIIQMLAGQGIHVMAEASDGQRAVQLARDLAIDVVVMDVRMPHMDGIQATRVLKQFHPGTQVVIFTMFEDEAEREVALEAGAFAYLVKGAAFLDLAKVIREAHSLSQREREAS